MSQPRYHNIVSTAEYARLHGISVRTARRRLASDSNAVKSGRGYKVSIPSTTYAKLAGISPKAARKLGVKTESPRDLITDTTPGTNPERLLAHLAKLAFDGKGQVSERTIRRNIGKMTATQRRKASRLTNYRELVDEMSGDEFLDDDGLLLLGYK